MYLLLIIKNLWLIADTKLNGSQSEFLACFNSAVIKSYFVYLLLLDSKVMFLYLKSFAPIRPHICHNSTVFQPVFNPSNHYILTLTWLCSRRKLYSPWPHHFDSPVHPVVKSMSSPKLEPKASGTRCQKFDPSSNHVDRIRILSYRTKLL